MKRFVLCALFACGHHDVEAESPHEQHTCDPRGATIAQYREQPDLARELFPDEIALEGTCSQRSHDPAWGIERILDKVEGESLADADCAGVCQPMHESLPALDHAHDLEDETLQRECTTAVTKLDGKIRAGCRHVCLIERREQASKAIFARVMRGLWSFNAKIEKKKLNDAEVRRMWKDAQLPLPPRRFVLATTAAPEMTAEGAYYPGGPPLRLKLAEENAGCGQTAWGVDRW